MSTQQNKERFRVPRSILLFFASFMVPALLCSQDFLHESPEARDARMQWWRDARFGMFIHWGVYSIPARGEWVMNNEKIPVKEYEKFPPQFNPVKFDAVQWVRLAKEAGMKYIVITSKHHDGFCMWDSKVTSYDIMDATPFKRDVLKELAEACRKEGIRFCLYHSIMDWHHPDAKGDRFPLYRDNYLKPQVKELLANYGPLGVLWFDGEWISEWTEEQGKVLYQYLRAIQPDLIINNRVGKGRNDMQGMNKSREDVGDFGTPEQEIPATGFPGVDWESCMTMNDNWGFAAKDLNWKSVRVLIENLVDIASKGGNYLLNVGPTAQGEIPQESIKRLKEIGSWLRVNGESIYGTRGTPFDVTPWGRCTRKVLPDGKNLLYLQLFEWPNDGRLVIPGLGSDPQKAFLLAEKSGHLDMRREQDAVVINLPSAPHDALMPVVMLEFSGNVLTYHTPTIGASAPIFLNVLDVMMSVESPELEVHYTLDGSIPSHDSPRYAEPIRLTRSAIVKGRTFHKGKPVSGVAEREFTQVKPRPAIDAEGLMQGLRYEYYEGGWEVLPEFDKIPVSAGGVTPTIDLNMRRREEKFGVRLSGYLIVPADTVYVLSLISDDGSRLYVGHQMVVENDGLHGSIEKQGVVALSKGAHPITITYFNNMGDKELRAGMAMIGGTLQPISPEQIRYRP